MPLLLFALYSFITVFWSQDQPQTIHAISRQLPLFLFPIAGMCMPNLSKESIIKLFRQYSLFLCGFAVVLTLLAFSKYHKYQFRGFLFYHDLVAPLELNAIYVSYLFSTFFLFNLSMLGSASLKKQLPIILMLGTFLVMLNSKMIISVTAVLAVLLLVFKIKNRIQKLSIFTVLLMGLILVFNFANPVKNRFITEFDTAFTEIFKAESFEKGRAYTGLEARLLQMRVSRDIIDTPAELIFGVGLSGSQKEITAIHKNLNTPLAFQSYNFHNQYIQVFTELGLLGLLLFLLMLGVAVKKSIEIKLFLPFIVISMALFLSESVIWRQRGILFFGIMYLLLLTTSRLYESKK
ncbi:O-antigen ligase family protein [Psychroserpens sp. BH13MA-6]